MVSCSPVGGAAIATACPARLGELPSCLSPSCMSGCAALREPPRSGPGANVCVCWAGVTALCVVHLWFCCVSCVVRNLILATNIKATKAASIVYPTSANIVCAATDWAPASACWLIWYSIEEIANLGRRRLIDKARVWMNQLTS